MDILLLTFTPPSIVSAMLNSAKAQRVPFVRIVGSGAGSGDALAVARAFPNAEVIAVEKDGPIAHLLRANVVAAGLSNQIRIVTQDYRSLILHPTIGPTLFIGNPPYVGHHDIETRWKQWYTAGLKAYDLSGSQLAGLHLHFLLKTRQLGPNNRKTGPRYSSAESAATRLALPGHVAFQTPAFRSSSC